MRRIVLLLFVITAILAVSHGPAQARISKVARKYNVFQIYGTYATPHGSYDQLGSVPLTSYMGALRQLDADLFLNGTYSLGVDYGTLYNRHILATIGFHFTEHNVQDHIELRVDGVLVRYNYYQYDIEFNMNYYMLDLANSFWSPYLGAGVQAGLTSLSVKRFDNESDIKFAASVNFGADLKIFGNKKGFVTLASMNNYNLFGSDNRPQYLNIGMALRYFFR